MGVSVKVGPGMLSLGEEFQQRRPIAHALDRTYAPVGVGVEVTEDQGWFVRSPVEFLSEPIQLLPPRIPFLPESNRIKFAWGNSITSA